MTAVDEETYAALISLTKGEFSVPVKDRSRAQKAAELSALVKKELKCCKGAGSRKLRYRLTKRFEGVSERKVQEILSKSHLNQKMNARFQNKAIIRPIRAKAVQVRDTLKY